MVSHQGGHFGQQGLAEDREEKILLENEGHLAHIEANRENMDGDQADQS